MKVVHLLGGGFNSGAGKAVKAIQHQLLSDNVESHVLGRLETELEKEDYIHRYGFWDKMVAILGRRIVDSIFKRKYGPESVKIQTIPIFGAKPQKYEIFKQADIIHIQWVGADTFDKSFWDVLARETRPVIWTLRDMWVLSGGCHFSGDCIGYETACKQCPYLPQNTLISHKEFAFKQSHIPKNTTFISISHHFKRLADKSMVVSQRDHRVIFNSVSPPSNLVPKSEARGKLSLPLEGLYVGSGALNLNELRKGSRTLQHLAECFPNPDVLHWLLFGQNLDLLLSDISPNIVEYGLIQSPEKLGHIYSASDIFVMPSLQESFGKTTAEAMLSGTPVIAYDNTPAEDMIEHGKTGWLVPHGDHKKFHDTLLQAINLKPEILSQMGARAQSFAQQHFSLDSIAQQHIELYKEKLGQQVRT